MPKTVFIATDRIADADVYHTYHCQNLVNANHVEERSITSVHTLSHCRTCKNYARPTTGLAAQLADTDPSEVLE